METKMTATNALKRCKFITAAILLSGLGSALAIYLTAAEAPVDPFAEFEKSKKFAYELERMGGKAALAANDLNKWFAGLWQGETLAYTVAVITLVVAAGYYFIATGLAAEAMQHPEDIRPTPFSE
jgi:hypothetical protein